MSGATGIDLFFRPTDHHDGGSLRRPRPLSEPTEEELRRSHPLEEPTEREGARRGRVEQTFPVCRGRLESIFFFFFDRPRDGPRATLSVAAHPLSEPTERGR